MRKLAQRFLSKIRLAWTTRKKRLAKHALALEISQQFRQLEARRVLSVNAAFANQILDITIQAGGNTDAALLTNGANFFVDADGDLTFDGLGPNGEPPEVSGLLTDLSQINVNGVGGIGTFLWQGNFGTSTNLASLNINNILTANLAATAQLDQNVNINVVNAASLGGNLQISGDLSVTASGPAGLISNPANSRLVVQGEASFASNTINLGNANGDNFEFGSLTFDASGAVAIHENSSVGPSNGMELTGNNSAGSVDLRSDGPLEFAPLSSLTASNAISIEALGVNSDVQIDGVIQSADGNITIRSADSIFLSATGSVSAVGQGNVLIQANTDLLNGNSDDLIQMSDGATISANTGTIRLLADGVDGGAITLGQVSTNNATDAAMVVSSTSGIVDGTAAETANLIAAGRIGLFSSGGGIGAGVESLDIDINGQELVFQSAANALGIVQINDLAGGIRIAAASSAGGTGFVSANSPLTISADVNLAASFVFTAGNSALAGDDLTINNNAVVRLNSAVISNLTFNAGDDIIFDTGRVVTTGALHTVFLTADREDLGADQGNADGDRGGISQTGAAVIDLTTNRVFITSGDGIELDTQIEPLIAENRWNGNIVIREVDGIQLVNVVNSNGSIDVIAAGTISAANVSSVGTDADANDVRLNATNGDVLIRTVEAGPFFGDVTITASENIIDLDGSPDNLDIRGNDITLTATNGSIGTTTTNIFVAVVNPIEVSASNDLTATALNGVVALDAAFVGALTLNSPTVWVQSNEDLDASVLVLNVTNLALIADADKNGTGVLTLGNALTVLGDLRLEGEDVVATDGTIDLRANRLLFFSGTTETIRTNVQQMDVTTDGSATVQSSVAVELIDLNRNNIAVQTLNATGSITVEAQGNILVSDDLIAGNDLIALSQGGIFLSALAPNANILINDVLWTDEGNIDVRAENDVLIGISLSPNDAADTDNLLTITTITGNVRLIADADADRNGAGGALTMVDGSRVIAGRGAGVIYNPGTNGLPSPTVIGLGAFSMNVDFAEILVESDENATIASLQTTNEGLNAIQVTSFSQGIVDAGDGAGDPNLVANNDQTNLIDAIVTLRAVTGIGNANPLETQVYMLDAVNLTLGDIRIDEIAGGGDLRLVGVKVPPGWQNTAPVDDIKIQVDEGSLIVDTSVRVVNGNILLEASEDVIINRLVESIGGHISVIAGDDIELNDNITAGQTVYMLAGNGLNDARLGVVMASTSVITTNNGNVRIQSQNGGDIRLGLIDAGAGSIVLRADRSIIDTNEGLLNVIGNALQMYATTGSIGESDVTNIDVDENRFAIDTRVNVIAALGATGIYILESNDLDIGDTGDIATTRVNFDSTTTAILETSFEDLATTNGGPIKVRNLAGDINIQSGSSALFGIHADGAGDILIRSANDLFVNSRVESVRGDVTLYAGDDLLLNRFVETSAPGTVLLYAVNANVDGVAGLRMDAGSFVTTRGGNVHAESLNGGDIILGQIDAGAGRVYLNAANSILDGNGAATNVIADRLAMIANAGIIGGDDAGNGTPDANINAIDTQVGILAAQSVLGIYVLEANDVSIGNTDSIAINRVNFNSTQTLITFSGLEDLRSGGPIKLQSAGGTITVNAGVGTPEGIVSAGAADILLQTLSANGDIVANAPVVSAGGDISFVSGDDVDLNSTILTSGAGFVNLQAANGTVDGLSGIDMAAASTITANNNVLLTSLNNGDIRLGLIDVGLASVSLNANGSILDGNGNGLNIVADRLRMVAANGSIGSSDASNGTPDANINAIDTQINTLAARSATGIYVLERNGVTVGDTLDIAGVRVNFNSTQTDLLDLSLEDLTTTNNGPIKLAATLGNIRVTPGALGNPGINAQGTGDVLLQTFADNGDIIVDAVIQSGTGDISLRAGDDIDLNNNVTTTGAGTIFFSAGNANVDGLSGIDMQLGTQVSNAGNIHFVTANLGDIRLSLIDGGTGRVYLSADRSIIDNVGADLQLGTNPNIRAGRLGMVAVNGRIGNSDPLNFAPDTNINAIDTSVDILAARAALGIYVQELNTVTVDDTGVIAVRQVNFNSTDPVRNERLEDLRTPIGGPIKLLNLAGDIIVNPGIAVPVGVSAGGSGDILLQAFRNLDIRGDIVANTGNISLIAGDNIFQQAAVRTGGLGSILMLAVVESV